MVLPFWRLRSSRYKARRPVEAEPTPRVIVPETHPTLVAADRQADIWAYVAAQLPSLTLTDLDPDTSSGNNVQLAAPLKGAILGTSDKPTVHLQACIHGSEMAATHALIEFVKRVIAPSGPNSAHYQEIQDTLRLSLIFCVSPAAYQPGSGSYTGGTRKAPSYTPSASPHLGTDPNRNWTETVDASGTPLDLWDEYTGGMYPADDPSTPDIDEGELLAAYPGGAATNPAETIYKGTAAWSLPETQAARDFALASDMFAFCDIHTYPSSSTTTAQGLGIDRNAAYASHYQDWASDRAGEIAALYPAETYRGFNITASPTATAWAAQQLAPDGAPVYAQIIETGYNATTTDGRTKEASNILTILLVLCTAWIDVAEARGL